MSGLSCSRNWDTQPSNLPGSEFQKSDNGDLVGSREHTHSPVLSKTHNRTLTLDCNHISGETFSQAGLYVGSGIGNVGRIC